MASFDLDAYYAEQDERMNLPDEDADEYVKRVSSYRRSQVHDRYESLRMPQASFASGNPMEPISGQLLLGSAERISAPVSPKNLDVESSDAPENSSGRDGRTIKRKFSLHQPVNTGKRKKADHQMPENQQQDPYASLEPQTTSAFESSDNQASDQFSGTALEALHVPTETENLNIVLRIASQGCLSQNGKKTTNASTPLPDTHEVTHQNERGSTENNRNPEMVRKPMGDPTRFSFAVTGPYDQGIEQCTTSSSSRMNDSTIEMFEPLGLPSTPKQSRSSRKVKLPEEPRLSPLKKRPRGPQESPESPAVNLSPITSFSRPSISSRETRPIRQEGIVAFAKTAQLDLQPMNEVTLFRPLQKSKSKTKVLDAGNLQHHIPRTVIRAKSGSPTSPIEDVSAVLPVIELKDATSDNQAKRRKVALEPSRLYMEVQERIAAHSNTKPRNRVVKLGAKETVKELKASKFVAQPTDDSSTICVSSSPSSRSSSPAPAGSTFAKQVRTTGKQPVDKRKAKGKKDKPQPMTPAEYARSLQAEMTASGANLISDSSVSKPKRKSSRVKFLEGKNIFYCGGDMKHASGMTRGRMDIIVKFGGNLMPEYDPKITSHIVTDAHERPTLRALGIKSLKEIPDHIPTVKWEWLLSVIGRETFLSKEEMDLRLGDVWLHAAFRERMDAGFNPQIPKPMPSFKGKGKAKAQDLEITEGNSNSAFTSAPVYQNTASNGPSSSRASSMSTRPPGAPLSPPPSPRCRNLPRISSPTSIKNERESEHSSGVENDPLAEFYHEAQAEKMREDGWSSLGELDMDDTGGEETDDEAPEPVGPIPKRGWTCDNKEAQRTTECPNQDIIDKLAELMELHKSKLGKEDHWRVFSYSKSIRALRNYPRRIKNYAEARLVRGVGEKTARKIEEILQTGDLRRITYENSSDVKVTRLFQGIYGVGQSIAHQWYASGCRTLEDVKAGKGGVKLSAAQEIGLRFYDDINDRMPRAEAKAIFDLIKLKALSIDPKLFVEIMGSYRRGKADCGDIDILITRPTEDGKTHCGVIARLMRDLHAAGILTEDLALPDDPNSLEATYRGLCRLPDVAGSRRRRIDFLSVPWICKGAALLYYTGDDIFNRAIRLKANVLGYSLNQKGLFGNVVRDTRDRRIKTNDGILVASETEEEIFRILKVPWQEPHERVRR
ncbi:hypothetical protein B0H34DRAFT_721306 [Crassisporium funariophilum]|nr:hypothetical protein B0H34DRAFT_721306 [Crassisporium funariophilum]